jgi:5-methylthioadenosine/S-adenosylhomocysteine deaminase
VAGARSENAMADVSGQAARDQSVDLVLRGATVLTMDGQNSCFDGDIAINEGEIVALGASLPHRGAEEIALAGQVVLPGFGNAHTHECMERGWFEDLGFTEWLNVYAQPKDRAYRPEHQHAAAGLTQLELIRSGFTSFIDMFRFPEVAAGVARASGLRATFAPQLVETPVGVGESLESSLALLESVTRDPSPLIRAWLGPHGLYSCSEETIQATARIAREHNVGLHTHLAESRDEVSIIAERSGLTPTAYLDQLIGLGPDILVAHAVELTPADIELLAERGVAVAHCPTSNLKLGNQIAPVSELLAAGVRVGLGTDSMMSNNILDPFAEMRMAALSAKYRSGDPAALPAQRVLELAIHGSADALQLGGQVGSIELGKRADVIAVDLASPHLWPLLDSAEYGGNLVEHLVYAARASDVTTTIVDGRVLMSERRVRTLDEGEIRLEVAAMARDLARRAGVESFVNQRLPKQRS